MTTRLSKPLVEKLIRLLSAETSCLNEIEHALTALGSHAPHQTHTHTQSASFHDLIHDAQSLVASKQILLRELHDECPSANSLAQFVNRAASPILTTKYRQLRNQLARTMGIFKASSRSLRMNAEVNRHLANSFGLSFESERYHDHIRPRPQSPAPHFASRF